jgi:hypothetical protein
METARVISQFPELSTPQTRQQVNNSPPARGTLAIVASYRQLPRQRFQRPKPHQTTPNHAMATQTLRGACACGRNRYVVEIPSKEIQSAELRYDNTSASRKCPRHPWRSLRTAWLRPAKLGASVVQPTRVNMVLTIR